MVDDFDEWYAAVRPAMAKGLAGWCGDPSLAADVLDEAFVRALERWHRVAAMEQPEGWVWRTAINVARRRMRRRALEASLLRRTPTAGMSQSGRAGDDLDLRQAILQLSERQRTAVVLHYLADLPQARVAELMGVAEGTVGATLHQARARLEALLTEVPEQASPRRSTTADAPDADGALS